MLPSSLRCFFLPVFLHHLPAFGTGIVHHSLLGETYSFFSFENLSFLLHVWSFLLSCLWFGSDQIPNTEVPHGSTLSSLCLLFITFQGFKNYLYANSCHVYTSCLDLLQCFFFICPNLLSWQIHMDVAQMSLT